MSPRTPARPAAKCGNESENAKSSTCTVFTKATAANAILPYPALIMNSAQSSANSSENGWATRPPWFPQYTATTRVITHYSWDRLQEACPYSFLDEEMYVWEALWAIRPAARARPFCPASSEGLRGVAGAGGMSA